MRWLAPPMLAIALLLAGTDAVSAFDGFGGLEADSTYGAEVVFEVDLRGGDPDRLELLIRTTGDDGAFVVPVEPTSGTAAYVWDTSVDYLTPNTLITYSWRATHGEAVTESEEAQIRYEDDRPGFDWQSAQLGEATVHWYGDAEAQARRFGELTAVGVDRAEELLGTELAGPVDVFVYASRDDFFGALGPGVREWTGAAAFPWMRTIFMWLGGGSADYLEVAMLHEVTHIVFQDADRQSLSRAGAVAERGNRNLVGDARGERRAADRRGRDARRRALLRSRRSPSSSRSASAGAGCRTPRARRWST